MNATYKNAEGSRRMRKAELNAECTMEIKDSPVKGGVSVLHKVVQGKHHYEVDHVMKFKEHRKSGPFVRKGDTLLKINGHDLQDLTPEAFAKLLTEASPMLGHYFVLEPSSKSFDPSFSVSFFSETVHSPSMEDPVGQCQEGSGMQPFSKEKTTLIFSMELRREEELAEDGDGGGGDDSGCPGGAGGGDDPLSGDGCCNLDDLFLVSMKKTSISVITGRGCEAGSTCQDCGGSGCRLNEVVMVSESSSVTLVSRGITNFLQERVQDDILIASLVNDMYIHRRNATPVMSRKARSNSAKITIYYYKYDCVDGDFRGVPVILNFTGTDCFLKCVCCNGQVTLRVENCEKKRLKHITSGDKDTWPFVFYMKATKDNSRRFESANQPGWFIHAKNEKVDAVRLTPEDESFLFVIRN